MPFSVLFGHFWVFLCIYVWAGLRNDSDFVTALTENCALVESAGLFHSLAIAFVDRFIASCHTSWAKMGLKN